MKTGNKPLGYYNYTVILTYAGMLCSFVGILMAIDGKFWHSLVLLMAAGFCDMFDGAVASTKKRDANEKKFGIQIDSFSDLISFGLLPAIFVYIISGKSLVSAVIAALFTLAALIRLAYYNVCEEARQSETTECRHTFNGVPVTTITVLLPIVYILHEFRVFSGYIPYFALLILCGIGFLSPIEVRKPQKVGKIALIVVGLAEIAGIIYLGRIIV